MSNQGKRPDKYAITTQEAGEIDHRSLQARDPERYKAVVAALKEGMSFRSIHRVLGVPKETAKNVIIAEGGEISTPHAMSQLKKARAASLDLINEKLSDPEASEKIELRDAGVIAGIVSDKIEKAENANQMNISTQIQVQMTPEELLAAYAKVADDAKDTSIDI